MTKAWETEFSPYANIKVSCGDIFTGAPAADSIVSPANSFGFMDGGIDLVGLILKVSFQRKFQ